MKKNTFLLYLAAFLLFASTACEVSSLQSNVSSRRDGRSSTATPEEAAGSEQPVNTVQMENGAMLSKDSANAVKMSGTSSTVVINPGSLSVDTQVSVAGYRRSDPNYIAQELGLENGDVEAVGITQVNGSSTESLAKPMTITLDIGSNLLGFFLAEPYYFVVCTARKAGRTPKVWTIASEDIVVTGNTLQFQTKEFGVFEVFKAYRRVTKIKEMRAAAMNAFAEPLTVSGLSTLALGAGKTVTINGKHLGDDTHVRVGGYHATITAHSVDQVSFTVPDFNGFGFRKLMIMNRYNTITKDVFYKGNKTDLPLIAQKPAEVCKGTAYYTLSGEKRVGTKVCGLADARRCTAAIKNDCLLGTSFKAIDPSTIHGGDLSLGYSLAGVSGTFDLLPSTTPCNHDGHTGCRASTAYKAADKSALFAAQIRAGITLGGVVGTFLPERPECTLTESIGCNIASASQAFIAVKESDLNPLNIRRDISIGNYTGTYPSADNPLVGASLSSLTQGTLPVRFASSATFEFYDRYGNRFQSQGDDDLTASNIVSGSTIWGVTGNYRMDGPSAEGSEEDYRWGYTYKNISSGKAKTNCRSLVPANSNNLPENNISGSVFDEPTQNPWDDQKFACKGEGWTVHTPNCTPSSQNVSTRCMVEDKKTHLKWTTAGMLEGSATQAQTHCDNLDYQGYQDWRVPTQKEAMQAFINGMSSLAPDLFRFTNGQRFYWTSTISRTQAGASNPPYWYIDMTSGLIAQNPDKLFHYLCVR